jgi:tetratricopeptide (TPR) repeat protein
MKDAPSTQIKDQQSQESRLLAKLERLTQVGSSEMGFVAEELQHLYERELSGIDLAKATPQIKTRTIDILKKIGDVNKMVGRIDNAMKFYDQVLEADPDSTVAADVHRTLGLKERDAANWSKANLHYRRSLDICRARNDGMGLADSHRGLAYVFWRRGDYFSALTEYTKALEVLRTGKYTPEQENAVEEKLAIIRIEEGNILGETGSYDEALECYKEAKSVLVKADNKWEIARLHNNIGHLYVNLGSLDDALKEFEACVKMGQRLKDPRWLGWGNFNLAEVYGRKGNAPKAKLLILEAKKHLTKINDRVGLAKTVYTEGWAHMAAGEIPEAKKHFEKSINMCEEAEMPSLVAYYSMQYGLALAKMGQKEEAQTVLRKALRQFKLIKANGLVKRVQTELDILTKA